MVMNRQCLSLYVEQKAVSHRKGFFRQFLYDLRLNQCFAIQILGESIKFLSKKITLYRQFIKLIFFLPFMNTLLEYEETKILIFCNYQIAQYYVQHLCLVLIIINQNIIYSLYKHKSVKNLHTMFFIYKDKERKFIF